MRHGNDPAAGAHAPGVANSNWFTASDDDDDDAQNDDCPKEQFKGTDAPAVAIIIKDTPAKLRTKL